MAGGSFTAPVAPKGSTTALIPYRPQQTIYQYLRFLSGLNYTKDGAEYVQKCRTSPQRSYKLDYKLTADEASKMEALLYNPELYYLPLWEQIQKLGKPLVAGSDHIDNVASIDDTDALFNVGNSAMVQVGSDWYSQDSKGDYFPPLGQPLIHQVGSANGTDAYINTGKKAVTDYNSFEAIFYYSSTIPATAEFIFSFYQEASKQAGIYRSNANTAICFLDISGTVKSFDAVAYNGQYLRCVYVPSATLGNKYYLYDMADNLLYETAAPVAGDSTTSADMYLFKQYIAAPVYWTDENGDFVPDENGDPIPILI